MTQIQKTRSKDFLLLNVVEWFYVDFKEDCHNFIRVLILRQNRLFVCGTNSYAPQCSWRKVWYGWSIENSFPFIFGAEEITICVWVVCVFCMCVCRSFSIVLPAQTVRDFKRCILASDEIVTLVKLTGILQTFTGRLFQGEGPMQDSL